MVLVLPVGTGVSNAAKKKCKDVTNGSFVGIDAELENSICDAMPEGKSWSEAERCPPRYKHCRNRCGTGMENNVFSHNGMISEKQMYKMLVLPVFAGGIFVLPYLFAGMFGESIVAGIIAYVLMAAVYVGTLIMLSGMAKEDSGKENKWFLYIALIRNLIRLVFYILLSSSILQEGQVPFVEKGNSASGILVLIPLLLVALYGASRDVEKQGRIYEMIFWTAFVPYVLMLCFGVKEIDTSVFVPHLELPISRLVVYGCGLLTFIVPIENYLWLKSRVKNGNTSEKAVCLSSLLTVLSVCVLSLVMAGIYGLYGMAEEPMVSIAIMRYIELPLGVLQRFDVLMVWFFMTGCFGLLSSTLFYMREGLLALCKDKTEGVMLVLLLAAAFMAFAISDYTKGLSAFVVYGALVDAPLSVLLPLVKSRMRRSKVKNDGEWHRKYGRAGRSSALKK